MLITCPLLVRTLRNRVETLTEVQMNYRSALFLVLFFGMVSCQSDNKSKTTEDFRIQEPQVVSKKTNDKKAFNAFSQQVKPDIAISDELQFQEAEGSFSILYNSHCRFGEKTVAQSGFRPSPKKAAFSSFLNPEQLRLIGENKDGAQCAFDFVAISSNGSKHHFKLPLVQLKDDPSANELSIIHPKSINIVSEVAFEQWSEHFLKLAKPGASEIILSCSSGSKTISINQPERLNLSTMPLQEMNLNWGLGAQSCRISQLQDSVVVGTSRNFVLVSPEVKIKTSARLLQHPFATNAAFANYFLSSSYLFEITNFESYPIKIKFPKQNTFFNPLDSNYSYPGLILLTGSKEWMPETVITLEPQETINIFHYVKVSEDTCRYLYQSKLFSHNNIEFQILSSSLPDGSELILKKINIKPYELDYGNFHGFHQDVVTKCMR